MTAEVTFDPSKLSPEDAAALEQEMQKASCVYFASQNLSGNVKGAQEQPGNDNRFIAGDHHLEWDELLNEKRLLVIAPRDHSKSYTFSMANPIWRMAYAQRGQQLYLFSSNQDRANELLQIIADELLNNPKLRWLVPARYDNKWSKRRIVVSTGGEIRARGFGVKVRGGHPLDIVCDDVLGDNSLWSETQRKKDTDYFFSAITNMVIPGGRIIVTSTPFHQEDLYAKIQEKGVLTTPTTGGFTPKVSDPRKPYKIWRRPALHPTTGAPLWPERHSKESLAAKKDEIGPIRFTREQLVQPISDDMSLFPSYLFEGEPVRQRAVVLGQNAAYWDDKGIRSRFMGVDIALSAEVGADYFVIVTLGLDDFGNRWLCDLFYAKGLSFHAQLDAIHTRAKLLDPALIYIEDNAMQRVWGDELIRTSDLPVKKFTTTAQLKNSMEKGIFVLRPLFENKKHRLPVGNAESVEKVEWLIAQFVNFAWVDGKLQGVGAHDDGPIAYWIANFACARGGSAFASFGDSNTRAQDPNAPKTAVAPGAPLPDATGAPRPSSGNLGALWGDMSGLSVEARHRLQAEKNARR